MARKIIGGVAGILGLKKKKKPAATETPATPQKGPIITQLGGAAPNIAEILRRRRGALMGTTLLSDKLGG